MGKSRLGRIACVVALLASAGAAGCFLSKDEAVESTPNEVNAAGDVSQILKSTLVLEGSCVAVKVGPKHLLLAAKCAVGHPAFGPGKTVKFKTATNGGVPGGAADEDDADSPDAGAKDAGSKDAGKDSGSKD